MSTPLPPVHIAYFTDVLCVWAYVSQIRLDELKSQLSNRVEISYHFINLFGCTETRIGKGWSEKGGYQGFCQHVLEVCRGFPDVESNPEVWGQCRPRSSATTHLFFKAVQLLEQESIIDAGSTRNGRTLFEELTWNVRCAFFRDARDISCLPILYELAESIQLPIAQIEQRINNGAAMAAWCRDMAQKEEHQLTGSPTWLLNEGRQKLFGNVGYRVIEANVIELLKRPQGAASWC